MANTEKQKLPFVSVCTPTFNRRPFIPFAIKCFQHQTYPKDRMEWIIIDDGTDSIEDLVKDIEQVKYFYYKDRMRLGAKRNLMHSKCSGDIIIYMDDDDYYPEERVSHAVETLIKNPDFLIAGCSEMHIYFDSCNKLYQFGPYKPYHSTAATFAFKKELLLQTQYNDDDLFSEENKFTKGYTIPLKQLDPLKSILVFSHQHNSLNKEKLLENKEGSKCKDSKYTVDDFIKDPILKQFYMLDMNSLLSDYEPGNPKLKPEILEQISQMEENRRKRIAEQNNSKNDKNIYKEMEEMKRTYEKKLEDKTYLINELLLKIKELKAELARNSGG
jgi:glycosyltransferase involved in cell wall biosynthesis